MFRSDAKANFQFALVVAVVCLFAVSLLFGVGGIIAAPTCVRRGDNSVSDEIGSDETVEFHPGELGHTLFVVLKDLNATKKDDCREEIPSSPATVRTAQVSAAQGDSVAAWRDGPQRIPYVKTAAQDSRLRHCVYCETPPFDLGAPAGSESPLPLPAGGNTGGPHTCAAKQNPNNIRRIGKI